MYLDPTTSPGDPVCLEPRCPRYGKPEYGSVCTSCGRATGIMPDAPRVPYQMAMSPVSGGVMPMPGPPADLGNRFLARLIDVVVVVAPVLLISLILPDFPDAAEVANGTASRPPAIDTAAAVLGVLWYLFALSYEVVMLAAGGGQTIGKRIMRIKVVRLDGDPIGWGPAAGRVYVQSFAAACTCGVAGLLFALSPLFDNGPWKRGWPDKIASTVVIRAGG